LSSQQNIEKLKIDVAEEFMKNTPIQIIKSPRTWREHLINSNNWDIERVAVCVDSAEDRIEVQAALPKTIFNAWTQQESIGVSRHIDFLNAPCLACLYLPIHKKKSRSEVVSNNLGILQHERKVRDYLATDKPVDMQLLKLVSESKNVKLKDLEQYIGLNIEIFHSKTVCGGILIPSDGVKDQKIEVPSAFESALAGILLAAEIIIEKEKLRKFNIPTISTINLLRPISKYINENQSKHHLGRCICHDEDFRTTYNKNWN